MLKTILLLLAVLLSGCVTTGPATERVRIIDTGCQWVKPIYVSRQDALTEGTAQQIEAHNETGLNRCGWKRKGAMAAP